MASSSSNVVGVHYRVGKKIGEGSFGVIFEGTNLLNNQQVAIKFVRTLCRARTLHLPPANAAHRNPEKAMLLNYEMNIERTRSSWDAVSLIHSHRVRTADTVDGSTPSPRSPPPISHDYSIDDILIADEIQRVSLTSITSVRKASTTSWSSICSGLV